MGQRVARAGCGLPGPLQKRDRDPCRGGGVSCPLTQLSREGSGDISPGLPSAACLLSHRLTLANNGEM